MGGEQGRGMWETAEGTAVRPETTVVVRMGGDRTTPAGVVNRVNVEAADERRFTEGA